MKANKQTFLFDLDGTLLDTAPDLALALNRVREEKQLPNLPIEMIRPFCGRGAQALVQKGLGLAKENPIFQETVNRFLNYYRESIYVHSTLFSGVTELIEHLATVGASWGIVTNKSQELTHLLLTHITWPTLPACVICGDTLAFRKPHPAPILHAMTLLKAEKPTTLFIGDSEFDVLAADAAGIDMAFVQQYNTPIDTSAFPINTQCFKSMFELLEYYK